MKLAIIISALLVVFQASARERLEPDIGCYFGISAGSDVTLEELQRRLGFTPAVYVRFYDLPFDDKQAAALKAFLGEVSAIPAIAMLTLQPYGGLKALSSNDYTRVAELCVYAESRGITGIFIRFGHEMNGNWYPWGQQPVLFKDKFRDFADTIHRRTRRTAMVWAPNYGVGYPFGTPKPQSGSADFIALDTNADGVLSDTDDMYEPYYPGDNVVDWVGMTLYHWGIDYPWLDNEMPPAHSFARSLIGLYQGKLPNFYARYAQAHHKPMIIPETAAFYNTERTGPDELALKRAWWQQIFGSLGQFPQIKCVNWFDELKPESVAQNNWIDWRISGDPRITSAFAEDFSALNSVKLQLLLAPEARFAAEPACLINIRRFGSSLVLECLGRKGETYQLWESSDLQSWHPIGNLTPGHDKIASWTLAHDPELRKRLFRIQVTR